MQLLNCIEEQAKSLTEGSERVGRNRIAFYLIVKFIFGNFLFLAAKKMKKSLIIPCLKL